MSDPCSHCGGTHFWPFDGNDVSCMNCGYVKKGESNNDDLYAMAQAPGKGHGPGCDCKDCTIWRFEGVDMRRRRELLRRLG